MQNTSRIGFRPCACCRAVNQSLCPELPVYLIAGLWHINSDLMQACSLLLVIGLLAHTAATHTHTGLMHGGQLVAAVIAGVALACRAAFLYQGSSTLVATRMLWMPCSKNQQSSRLSRGRCTVMSSLEHTPLRSLYCNT